MKKLLCLLLLLTYAAWAGNTGKIAGKVTDAATGQPLPSVNVMLVGTTMGATTDPDGNFFILNIPVGTYSVRASILGYGTKAVTNVRIMADMTTTLDFSLSTEDIQMRDVVVTAERPAIQQDKTATKHIIDEDAISALPVDDFREIVQLQAGVVGSHFRGGRFNEAMFLVDGIPIRSAVNGYTGNTGGFAINLPQIGVSEIQVSTGGFEAEYGNAQSGIVNTVMRDPSSRFSAKLRARTSDFPWTKMEWRPNAYGSGQPDWRNYEVFLSTPAVELLGGRFSLSGSSDVTLQTKDFLPHQDFIRESYQMKFLAAFPSTRISITGLKSWTRDDDYYHRYSKYGPLSDGYTSDLYQRVISEAGQSVLEQFHFVADPQSFPAPVFTDYGVDSIDFNGRKYRYVRDIYQSGMQEHISVPVRNSYNVAMLFTHSLNERSYIDVKASHFMTHFREIVRDVDDRDKDGNTSEELNWQDNNEARYPTAGYKDRSFETQYWYFTGDEGWWFNQRSSTSSIKLDYSNQFNNTNLLKAGAEFSYNKGVVDKVSFESVLARRFDVWSQDLFDLGFYVQDKIEVRDGFILNAGLRFDYYDPNGFGTVLYPADIAELSDPTRRTNLTDADKIPYRWQISPRVGISHPLTDRDRIHFYYGHFFQRPDFRYLYENLRLDFSYTTNVDLGNPRLNPEKTVSYEVGWEHLFSDWLRLGITGYFKDITNLVAATDFDIAGLAEPFQAYTNADYANVRGIEINLETINTRSFGGTVNYTYAFANGRSSTVFRSNGEIVPRRLDPLDWDVRHKINANVSIRSLDLVDEYIGNAELTFVFTAQSGLPYTSNTRDVFPLFTLRNDGRLPWSKNVDMRFRKSFEFSMLDISLLAEVRNVFNWINLSYIAGGREGLEIYNATGDPTGPYNVPTAWTLPRVYRLGIEVQLGGNR